MITKLDIKMSEQKVYATTLIMMQALEDISEINFDVHNVQVQAVYLYEATWKNDSQCVDKDEVTQGNAKEAGCKFVISKEGSYIGWKLQVDLKLKWMIIKRKITKGTQFNMTFQTVANSESEALNFYKIPNTNDYFFYLSCYALNCRQIFPLQDTPLVKSPLEINLTIEESYGIYSNGEEQYRKEIIEDGVKKINVYFSISE